MKNKVISYLCLGVPREMIYAAGFIPKRLFGEPKPVTKAQHLFTNYACHICKSVLEEAVDRKIETDGMVMTYTCDAIRGLSYRIEKERLFPYFYFLIRPQNKEVSGADEFFSKELLDFKRSLENLCEREIRDEDLRESIEIYNKNRELMRKLDEMRASGKARPKTFYKFAIKSLTEDPKDVNEELSEFVKIGEEFDTPYKIHIFGSVISDTQIFSEIEDMSGHIVSDDLCIGIRPFLGKVEDGDPILELAKYYLFLNDGMLSCPYMTESNRVFSRFEFIKNMISSRGAKGVVFMVQRYCDPNLWDFQFLQNRFSKEGIPTLFLETEHKVAEGQLKTRLEAFFEAIGG